MTVSSLKRLPAADPIDEVRQVPAPQRGKAGAAAPTPKSKCRKEFTGPVQVPGDHWVTEIRMWQHRLARSRSLDKLAIKVGIELSWAIDGESKSRDRGFAIRSHGWLSKTVGGTENNVERAIEALKYLGFLAVESRKHLGRANRYRLMFPDAAPWDNVSLDDW